MSYGGFSLFKVYAALYGRTFFAAYGSDDNASLFWRDAGKQCQVLAFELVVLYHGGKNACTDSMLCQNSQPRSIPVQAVNTAEGERKSQAGKVVSCGIGQGIVMVILGRVDGHVRRFIDDQQIFILIYNGEGQDGRKYLFRGRGISDMDGEPVGGLKLVIDIMTGAVYQNAVHRLL